jgi:hypothetical protein
LAQNPFPGESLANLLANLDLHDVFDLWASVWRGSGSVSVMYRNVETDVEGSTARVVFFRPKDRSHSPAFEQLPTVKGLAANASQ